MLLDLSPDFDARDIQGNSPLVYAAAYGCLESGMLLLKAGANPLKDQHLEFLRHAMQWDRWDVMTEALRLFRAHKYFSPDFLQNEMTNLITSTWSARVMRSQPERFILLLKLGADKHAVVKHETRLDEGSTLLHEAYSREAALALFDAGVENVDRFDSIGHSSLMRAIGQRQYGVGYEVLAQGCKIKVRNDIGRSALHAAYTSMIFRSFPRYTRSEYKVSSVSLRDCSDGLAFIAKLLQHNADIWSPDNCRCPCSPGGCPPFLQLPRDQTSCYFSNTGGAAYIWILEWLLMFQDLRGPANAHRAMQCFNCIREFELSGLTHVCCRKICTDDALRLYDERIHASARRSTKSSRQRKGSLQSLIRR
jgi:ankyrin repeat protein